MAKPGQEIADFTELYQRMVGDRPFVGSLVTGHLAIEFLLRRLVAQYDARLAEHADTLRHHALIALSHQIGTISAEQRDILTTINRLRNKLAHQISFEPTMKELRHLWRRSGAAFSDLTDGISQGIEVLDSAASVDVVELWVFAELFVQICYDLHGKYVELGGEDEAF